MREEKMLSEKSKGYIVTSKIRQGMASGGKCRRGEKKVKEERSYERRDNESDCTWQRIWLKGHDKEHQTEYHREEPPAKARIGSLKLVSLRVHAGGDLIIIFI